ncbi:Kelch repeat-containing protein [Geothrix terrae]|uniref:Kelch repeat-containing protein n=1 Tax=Geothrix terrae TaxID=2922720 RepID=UPI001FACFA54|nr:hypothetical protein [Geothrix terrae]
MKECLWIFRPVLVVLMCVACGGGGKGGSSTPPIAIAVSINPTAISLEVAQTQTFTAQVNGRTDENIRWSCTGGTLSASNGSSTTFTAGSLEGGYTVTAASGADASKTATAAVTIRNPTPAVILTQSTFRLLVTESLVFMEGWYTTTGLPSNAVTLTVLEGPAGGAVGLGPLYSYTPPQTPGTYHIRVSSVDVPSVHADMTIHVVEQKVQVLPDVVRSVVLGETVQLTATVLNAADKRVTWSLLSPGSPAEVGTLTSEGLYTAPMKTNFEVEVYARSVEDPLQGNPLSLRIGQMKPLPAVLTIGAGSTHQMSYTWMGPSIPGVMWFVGTHEEDAAGFPINGTISPGSGLYVAPEAACETTIGVSIGSSYSTNWWEVGWAPVHVTGNGPFVHWSDTNGSRRYGDSLVLQSGEILLNQSDLGPYLAKVNPITGQVQEAGRTLRVRGGAGTCLLGDGKVLFVGGGADETAVTAEVYDPATETSVMVGNIQDIRRHPTATKLPNGKVLVYGGVNEMNLGINRAEMFDPATGLFTAMNVPIGFDRCTATELLDGRILFVGYEKTIIGTYHEAWLFDPVTSTFVRTGDPVDQRETHTATRLGSGKVLITGGTFDGSNTAEIYDPASGTFSPTANFMKYTRRESAAIALDDHRILILGGGALNVSGACEIYDDRVDAFTFAGSLTSARRFFKPHRLGDGSIVVAGGDSMTIERWAAPN